MKYMISNVNVVIANMTMATLFTFALLDNFWTFLPFIMYSTLSLGTWLLNIWYIVIDNMAEMYHKNHKSTYLKYDVFGMSSFKDERRATRTSNVVTDPTNLSEKLLISMKRVNQASSHKSIVGKNVPSIWSIMLWWMLIENINLVSFSSLIVSLVTFEIWNWLTVVGPR